jgi:hypothetical protein
MLLSWSKAKRLNNILHYLIYSENIVIVCVMVWWRVASIRAFAVMAIIITTAIKRALLTGMFQERTRRTSAHAGQLTWAVPTTAHSPNTATYNPLLSINFITIPSKMFYKNKKTINYGKITTGCDESYA